MATFRIWSDLHLEAGTWRKEWFENSHGQYLILAGDICEIRKHLLNKEFYQECNDNFIKTFYVPGNHEYWEAYLEKWSWAANQFKEWGMDNIVPLQQEKAYIEEEDITIFGATLWYDASHLNNGMPRAYLKQEAKDYKYIGSIRHGIYTCLRPSYIVNENVQHTQWLENEVQACQTKKIVVTHHGPTPFSKDPTFDNDHKEYVNDLDLTKIPADYWVHGHIHYSHWYVVDDVTVVCNPRGYEIYDAVNERFDHQFVIEV